jgi:hypothetical protein
MPNDDHDMCSLYKEMKENIHNLWISKSFYILFFKKISITYKLGTSFYFLFFITNNEIFITKL